MLIDPTVFNTIIEAVTGGEPVRNAITEAGISARKFYQHLDADAPSAERYARAKMAALEAMADEIVSLSDQARRCVKTTTKANGDVETVELDQVDRSRLQVDSRKWLLSKLAPKKYGDKQEVSVTGGLNIVAVHGTDSSLV